MESSITISKEVIKVGDLVINKTGNSVYLIIRVDKFHNVAEGVIVFINPDPSLDLQGSIGDVFCLVRGECPSVTKFRGTLTLTQ